MSIVQKEEEGWTCCANVYLLYENTKVKIKKVVPKTKLKKAIQRLHQAVFRELKSIFSLYTSVPFQVSWHLDDKVCVHFLQNPHISSIEDDVISIFQESAEDTYLGANVTIYKDFNFALDEFVWSCGNTVLLKTKPFWPWMDTKRKVYDLETLFPGDSINVISPTTFSGCITKFKHEHEINNIRVTDRVQINLDIADEVEYTLRSSVGFSLGLLLKGIQTAFRDEYARRFGARYLKGNNIGVIESIFYDPVTNCATVSFQSFD